MCEAVNTLGTVAHLARDPVLNTPVQEPITSLAPRWLLPVVSLLAFPLLGFHTCAPLTIFFF